jgi:hypothetical protein
MSALGLAIMIVAGAVTLDVVLENTRNTDASVVGQTVANVDLGGFFTAGVLVGVALMLGLMLLLAGLRRANRKRLERKELTRNYEGTAAHVETLQEERDRLAAELERERAARPDTRETASAPLAATGATTQERPLGATGRTSELGHGAEHATGHTAEHTTEAAPVYPTEQTGNTAGPGPAAGPAASPAAGTATQERTAVQQQTATQQQAKPSLKERLLGR